MNFLGLLELFAAYCFVAFLLAAAGLAVAINLYGKDPLDLPLLDGRRLRDVLDDRDRGFLVESALAEDREVAWLDSVWEMPAREPRL